MVDTSRTPRLKIRWTSAGAHLFDRASGWNALLDEVVTEPSQWARAPRQVSVALTNACDLHCRYCYAPKVPGRAHFDRVLDWLVELDAHGCLGVGFGGGEPTLVRDFARLCHKITSRTQLAVTFTTHGHHLDSRRCAEFEGAVHFIRISMDGVGETYERLRGRPFATLRRRMDSVRRISAFGINYVVNADTVTDLDHAADIAATAGASELLLLPEQPTVDSPGIDLTTMRTLGEWVSGYRGVVPLTASAAGSDGLPACTPIPQEAPLDAYAHIDANGILKRSSYDKRGVAISDDGALAAMAALREEEVDPA